MGKFSRVIKALAAVLCLTLLLGVHASAAPTLSSAYGGYEYDGYKNSSLAPVTYLSDGSLNGSSLGLENNLNAPSDMVYDKNGTLYVLDSGNGRVVAIDTKTLKARTVYDDFVDKNGKKVDFTGALGMDIGEDGSVLIADTANMRVLVFDKNHKLRTEILRPDVALSGTETPFDATKVMLGNDGVIYVICKSINTGILTFTPEGEFKVFYGSNNVEATATVLKNYFYNKFLTREQRAARASVTPTNFANMTLDANNFVYTVKSEKFIFGSSDVVQCLNYTGGTIINEEAAFGEFENDSYTYYWNRKNNSFTDIDIDNDGFINVLDSGYGRVYQYSVDGDFLGAFGAVGNQNGTMQNPSAIETVDGAVLVLDAAKNVIHKFEPTEYGLALREAFMLSESTDLSARLEAWQHVLRLNTNSTFPYYGIGLVYDEMGEYAKAMDNFRIAGAQTEYSKAFKQYRKTAMADNALWIALAVVLLVVAIILIVRFLKKKMRVVDGTAYSPLETKWGLPIYTLLHPVDAFDQFKDRKTESVSIATGIVALWFVVDTLSFFFTGFAFSTARVTDFQLFVEIIKTLGLFILFVSANWSMCTLLNGKGTFKEIYCGVAYALIPYILSIGINTVLSNFLTESEGVFMTLITAVALVWSIAILVFGLITLHEYSFLKMLGSVLLTVLAMAVIGFLIVLFYTLMLQVYSFIDSLVEELKIR